MKKPTTYPLPPLTPQQAVNNLNLFLELSGRNSYEDYRSAVQELAALCLARGIQGDNAHPPQSEPRVCTMGPPAATVNECAEIAAAEFRYWSGATEKDAVIPSGAAANILAAILGYRAPWHPKPKPDNEDAQAILKAIQPRVLVEVTGGVAEVTECSQGVQVEIIDHDKERNA